MMAMRFPSGQITGKYLFSPLRSDQQAFANKPLSASALGKRLSKHLTDAGLYDGESNHGFRRGQIQNMVASGMAQQEISQVTQIKTLSVIDLYADLSRHVPRLERLHQSAAA